MSHRWMTIANAALLIGITELAVALAAPPPVADVDVAASLAPAPAHCDDGLSSATCLPTFSTVSCFDRSDRDECLRTELEDQAIAYSTGVEVYHRAVQLRRLPPPIEWKTMPPPFICRT